MDRNANLKNAQESHGDSMDNLLHRRRDLIVNGRTNRVSIFEEQKLRASAVWLTGSVIFPSL